MAIQKWQLLFRQDISPSRWFPMERRVYKMPNGKLVDDFTVATLQDVAMVVAQMHDGKFAMARMFKQGADDVMTVFPAGRFEGKHGDITDAAQHELQEETGVQAHKQNLVFVGRISGNSTKSKEIVHVFVAVDCPPAGEQKLDETEEIEVVYHTADEIDVKIANNEIYCALSIAAWQLAKNHLGLQIKG